MRIRSLAVFRTAIGLLFLIYISAGAAIAADDSPRAGKSDSAAGLAKEAPAGAPGGEIELLKRQLTLQQEQIERLSQIVLKLQQRMDGKVMPAEAAASGPAVRSATGSRRPDEAAAVASAVPVIPAGPASSASGEASHLPGGLSGAGTGRPVAPAEQAEVRKPSPLTIRIGEADFKLGGFMDFTSIYRSTNVGSGIGTSFGSIPFSNTPEGRLSETRFSGQNSRVSLQATSKVGSNNVTGYLEADFLGVDPSNAFVTSNSHSLRLRLYWVDVRRGKFEFLAGQSWSLMNPNRHGLSPDPSDVFYTQNMDTNYQVGLTWSRNPQFRLIYHPSAHWTAGISFENPQQFVGGAVALPAGFDSKQVDTGGNVSTPNLHPDIAGKVAYDGRLGGRDVHVEAAGLLSSFRVFNPLTNSTATATGGGGSVNLNLETAKNLRLILNTFYSDGGGRYIFGLGPDFIVKPDGTPSLVHAGSGIAGFEYQYNPKTALYGYYGGAYFQRNTANDPVTGDFLGFGSPGSTSSANRSLQEATFGVTQTFWKNPQYGALQLITQYSYLTRSPWSVAVGAPKNAHLSMGYVNVRYVLP